MKTGKNRSKMIAASSKTLSILEIIRDAQGIGVTEISEKLDFSRASVHHHIATLLEYGLIAKNGRKYYISFNMLSFGAKSRERVTWYEKGNREISNLAQRTGLFAQLVVEEGNHAIPICHSTSGTDPRPSQSPLGEPIELHSTAAGKLILAAKVERGLGRDNLKELNLVPRTKNTLTDADDLIKQLNRIQEENIAFEDKERYKNVRALATSVPSEDGISGVVSLIGSTDQITEQQLYNEFPKILLNAAGKIRYEDIYSPWTEEDEFYALTDDV